MSLETLRIELLHSRKTQSLAQVHRSPFHTDQSLTNKIIAPLTVLIVSLIKYPGTDLTRGDLAGICQILVFKQGASDSVFTRPLMFL